uniref:Uncharacterized protein n=1 Tax=Arundo donax TaxID=35708 RepID=A0A0A9GHA9_ARUDO
MLCFTQEMVSLPKLHPRQNSPAQPKPKSLNDNSQPSSSLGSKPTDISDRIISMLEVTNPCPLSLRSSAEFLHKLP